jgi:hypothetical protein
MKASVPCMYSGSSTPISMLWLVSDVLSTVGLRVLRFSQRVVEDSVLGYLAASLGNRLPTLRRQVMQFPLKVMGNKL